MIFPAVMICMAISVADGDTLTARCPAQAGQATKQVRVRFAAIDAPEIDQPYGRRAKQAMTYLVEGKRVKLDCYKQDRYGRAVCDVFKKGQDGYNVDAGLTLVHHGLAWWYRAFKNEQPRKAQHLYRNTQRQAKAERRGLWRDNNPQAPWDWRRTH